MKIGVCTGGGDCPGLNAAIRAIVRYGTEKLNFEIYGIFDSFNGLMVRPTNVRKLTNNDVTDILTKGGTILGTHNTGNPYGRIDAEDKLLRTKEGFELLGLDALIVIGGEGTQSIAQQLISVNIPIVGIPKTIDNDLPGTEQTIGFSTCADLVTESTQRLQSTAESHDRIMILEVMGRDSGFIALHGGLAGGAHAILIPEIEFDLDKICKKIESRKKNGKNYSVIVISEGACEKKQKQLYTKDAKGKEILGGIGSYVAKRLSELTKMETRVTVLGHLQRGGSPNSIDRILASRFAIHALNLLKDKHFGKLVVLKNNKITEIDYSLINKWERQKLSLDDEILRTAESVGICFGR